MSDGKEVVKEELKKEESKIDKDKSKRKKKEKSKSKKKKGKKSVSKIALKKGKSAISKIGKTPGKGKTAGKLTKTGGPKSVAGVSKAPEGEGKAPEGKAPDGESKAPDGESKAPEGKAPDGETKAEDQKSMVTEASKAMITAAKDDSKAPDGASKAADAKADDEGAMIMVTKTMKKEPPPDLKNIHSVAENRKGLDLIIQLLSGIKPDHITRKNKDDLDNIQTLIKNIHYRENNEKARIRAITLNGMQKAVIRHVCGADSIPTPAGADEPAVLVKIPFEKVVFSATAKPAA